MALTMLIGDMELNFETNNRVNAMKNALFILAMILLLTGGFIYAMPTGMSHGGGGWSGTGNHNNHQPGNNAYDDNEGTCGNKHHNGPDPSHAVVPEPTTIALFGLGALGMGLYRRVRK